MSSFDFSFINNNYTQPQAQQLTSTANPSEIKKNDSEQLSAAIKDYSQTSSEEAAIEEILKSQNIALTKINRAIAMALYYQGQDINEATMAYMHKMMDQYRFDSQVAIEAFLFLVANSLEITDHRIQAVKEIMDNKDFVTEIKDLSGKIDELNQYIDQMVDNNIDTSKIMVDDLINDNTQQNLEIDNIIDDKSLESNIQTGQQINEAVNTSIDENNLLLDSIHNNENDNKAEIKNINTDIKTEQKEITNNFNSNQKVEVKEINKNTEANQNIQNKLNTNVEVKQTNEIKQVQKSENKIIEKKVIVQQKSEEKIADTQSSKNKDNSIISQTKPISPPKTKLEYKKINSDILQILSPKNNSNQEKVVSSNAPPINTSSNNEENVQTFESGIRNTGISQQAKESAKSYQTNNVEIDNSEINSSNENVQISDKPITEKSNIKNIITDNLVENTPTLFKLNGKDVVISKSSEGKIYFKNVDNLSKNVQEPIKVNLNNQSLYIIPTDDGESIIPALKVDNSVSEDINNLFRTNINNKDSIVVQDPFNKDKTVIIPLNNKREFKTDKDVFLAEDKTGHEAIFINKPNKEAKLINLSDKSLNTTEITTPILSEEKLIFPDAETNNLKSIDLKLLSKNSENLTKNISVISDNDDKIIITKNKDGKLFKLDIKNNVFSDKLPENVRNVEVNGKDSLIYFDQNSKSVRTVNTENLTDKQFNKLEQPLIVSTTNGNSLILSDNDSLKIVALDKNLFTQSTKLEKPVLTNINGKENLVVNDDNNQIKIVSVSNKETQVLKSPVIAKINGTNSIIFNDNGTNKIVSENSLNSINENLPNKLKVSIDGKAYVITSDSQTGEQIILPEKNDFAIGKIDLSQPVKISQDGENKFLIKNNNKISIFSEKDLSKISNYQTLNEPIVAQIKDKENILVPQNKGIIKISDEINKIKNNSEIKNPVEVNIDNVPHIVIPDSNGFKAIKTENLLNNSSSLQDGTINVNNKEQTVVSIGKTQQIISSDLLSRLSKPLDNLQQVNVNNEDFIFIKNDNGKFVLKPKSEITENSQEIIQPFVFNQNKKVSIGIPDKNGLKVFDYQNIIRSSTDIKSPLLSGKKNENIQIVIPDKNTGKHRLVNVSNEQFKNIAEQKEPFIIKTNDSYKIVLPEKGKLNAINIEKKDIDKLTELKGPIKLNNNETLALNNKNNPVIIDNNKLKGQGLSLEQPIEVSIDGKNSLITKDTDKVKVLSLENPEYSQMQELDLSKINTLEIINTTDNVTSEDISNNINILKTKLGINDDLENMMPETANILNIKKNNLQNNINNKNQVSENINTKSGSENNPITFEQKISLIRQYLAKNVLNNEDIGEPNNDTLIDNTREIEETGDVNSEPKLQNKINNKSEKLSFNSLLNSLLADPKAKDMIVESTNDVVFFKKTFEDENILLKNPNDQKTGIVNINQQNKQNFAPDTNPVTATTLTGEASLLVNNKLIKLNNLNSSVLDNSEPMIIDNKVIFHDKSSKKNKLTNLNKIKNENIINIPVKISPGTPNIPDLIAGKPVFVDKNTLSNMITKSKEHINIKNNENKFLVIPDEKSFKFIAYSDLLKQSEDINQPIVIANDKLSKITVAGKNEINLFELNNDHLEKAPVLNEPVLIGDDTGTKLVLPEKNNKYSSINLQNNFSEINQPYIINHDGEEKILFSSNNKNIFINISTIKNEDSTNEKNIVLDNNMKNYLERLSNKNSLVNKEKAVNPDFINEVNNVSIPENITSKELNSLTIEQKVNLVRQFLGNSLNKNEQIDNSTNTIEKVNSSNENLEPVLGIIRPKTDSSENNAKVISDSNKVPFDSLLRSILSDPKVKDLVVEEINDIGLAKKFFDDQENQNKNPEINLNSENNNSESSLFIAPKIINYQGKEKLLVNIDNQNLVIDVNKLKNFEKLYSLDMQKTGKQDLHKFSPEQSDFNQELQINDVPEKENKILQDSQSENEPTFEQKINLVRQLININEGKKEDYFKIKTDVLSDNIYSEENESLEKTDYSNSTNILSDKNAKTDIKISFDSLLNSILSDPKAKNLTVENISNLVLFKQTHQEENALVKNPETQQFEMVKINSEDKQNFQTDNQVDLIKTTSGHEAVIIKNNKNINLVQLDENNFNKDMSLVSNDKNIFISDKSGSIRSIEISDVKNDKFINLPDNLVFNSKNEHKLILKEGNKLSEVEINDDLLTKSMPIDKKSTILNINGKASLFFRDEKTNSVKTLSLDNTEKYGEKINQGIQFKDKDGEYLILNNKSNKIINLNETTKDNLINVPEKTKVSFENKFFKVSYDDNTKKLSLSDVKTETVKKVNLPIKIDFENKPGYLIKYIDNSLKFIPDKSIESLKSSSLKAPIEIEQEGEKFIVYPYKNNISKINVDKFTNKAENISKPLNLDDNSILINNNGHEVTIDKKELTKNAKKINIPFSFELNNKEYIAVPNDKENKFSEYNKVLREAKNIEKPILINGDEQIQVLLPKSTEHRTANIILDKNSFDDKLQPIVIKDNNEAKIIIPEKDNKVSFINLQDKKADKDFRIDKPIQVNHEGHEKILISKGDKNIFIDIDKLKYFDEHKSSSSFSNDKKLNLLDSIIDDSGNSVFKNNLNLIQEDANKMNNLLKNFLDNDVLNRPENFSQQISMMSQMFGVFETQVNNLKQELEPFKNDDHEEFTLENPFANLLSAKKLNEKDNRTEKKDNHHAKLSFDKLLNSVLSEISSKVEKISLNLQGREILSNNEKCFCIPLSIPYGDLKFNGEILIKDERDKHIKSGGKVLSITLAVETKNLDKVLIDFLSIDNDLQISIKVDNKRIKDIFDQKLSYINELMKTSRYKVKPITCIVNPNKNRGNSLLVPRNSFPKSLKRIEGII